MGTQDSALVWEQMGMDAVARDFERLFPAYSFDGEAVLADIMGGRLGEALKKLAGGVFDAVLFQRDEYRTLFFTILVLGVAAALFQTLPTCSATIRYRISPFILCICC